MLTNGQGALKPTEDNNFVMMTMFMAHPQAEATLAELNRTVKAYNANNTSANMQAYIRAIYEFTSVGMLAMKDHPKGHGWPRWGYTDTIQQHKLATELFDVPSIGYDD